MILRLAGAAPATTRAIWSGVGTLQQPPFDAPGAAIREREGAAPVEIGIVREVGFGRCWNGRVFTEKAIIS
jgi:hypothetical protein